jgi:23S rRNA (uridine2552-2'-O)-methyltransferase
MKRRGSSARWLAEHNRDSYVQRARREGRVARSAYKLIEIDERDKLIRPGAVVVDLGAAPGGWSEYAVERVGDKGTVIALDLLPMTAPADVTVIQGDFREQECLDELLGVLDGREVDVVLSDMAPNFSGTRSVDQLRSMDLAELALSLAGQVLSPRGSFLVKAFHGEGFDDFMRAMREQFTSAAARKPDASRSRSRETYLLGRKLSQ